MQRLWYLWKEWWKLSLLQEEHKTPTPQSQRAVCAGRWYMGGRARVRLWSLTYRVVQCMSPFSLLGIVGRVRILLSLPLTGSKAHPLHDECLKELFASVRLLVCVRCVHLSNIAEGCTDAVVVMMVWKRGLEQGLKQNSK